MKMYRVLVVILLVMLPMALGGMSGIFAPFSTDQPAENVLPSSREALSPANSSHCSALPNPLETDTLVDVSNVAELRYAVDHATPHTTIRLANGTYDFYSGNYLWIDVPYVTLRSASGNRETVVLDGHYDAAEIITIAASNVTIADLTLQRAQTHPIHVVSTSSGDTLNTLIYNVRLIDPGQQAIKINPYRPDTPLYFPDDGVIACSHIELTENGRPNVWAINGSCYTGGVDAHQARGWVIRDNLIEGFWCPDGLSEHAIHFWRGSRDTVVERNELVNNARGIGFGLDESGSGRTYADNPCPAASGGYVDHYGGVIRNNFVFASQSGLFVSEYGFDCGICLWQACNAQALHNTVFTGNPGATFSSIEWRFSNTEAHLINNLVNDTMRERDSASATQSGNLTNAQSSWFVDSLNGDLHLVSTAIMAIDQVTAPPDVSDDFDGDPRPGGSQADIGADEYGIPAPAAVTDLRVTDAVTVTGILTATLAWTSPNNAITYTLRYSNALITEVNWLSAITVAIPFSAASPGTTEWLTHSVPYANGTIYFALKSQNVDGKWSGLSNNAFWPSWEAYLPVVLK